jgi:hypothetical protein
MNPAPRAEKKGRMQNRIVVRRVDGGVLKGFTTDFLPTKDVFHLNENAQPGAKPLEVRVAELKAIFFVKDLRGNPTHVDRNEFDPSHPAVGRKIRVVFKDGELLIGTTQGYQPGRPGFFVIPADSNSNNERCFVISAAVQNVTFI